MSWLRRLHENHQALIHHVHSAWRYPLPAWGQRAMGLVYFTVPLVGGYFIMQWANQQAEANLSGASLETYDLLTKADNDASPDASAAHNHPKWGGVRLTDSDAATQANNERKTRQFMRQLRRQQKQQQQQQQQNDDKEPQ